MQPNELRDMLRSHGFTDAKFIRFTGIGTRTLYNWYQGKNPIPTWPSVLLSLTPLISSDVKRAACRSKGEGDCAVICSTRTGKEGDCPHMEKVWTAINVIKEKNRSPDGPLAEFK